MLIYLCYVKKFIKFESPLYKLIEQTVEIENPYDKAAEFKVRIIESASRGGSVRNPFNENESSPTVGAGGGDTSSLLQMKSKSKMTVDNYKSINQLISQNK